MAVLHRILLHQNFLEDVNELAPPKSELRKQVNQILADIRKNPRARKFKKSWTFDIDGVQVVTRRAHFGTPSGYRLIFGLFQHGERRSVDIVPLLMRKDKGFRYAHKALSKFVNSLVNDYLDDEYKLSHFRTWEGEL